MNLGSNRVIERHAADCILVLKNQKRQRRRDGRSVFVLGEMPVSIPHTAGNVDQQVDTHVGVFFELLNIKPILTSPDFLIDVAKIVTRGILTMLEKLDRLPKVRTAMHSRKESFDNMLSP